MDLCYVCYESIDIDTTSSWDLVDTGNSYQRYAKAHTECCLRHSKPILDTNYLEVN